MQVRAGPCPPGEPGIVCRHWAVTSADRLADDAGERPDASDVRGMDDHGCAVWVAANTHGYVLNLESSMNLSDARVHKADYRTITGTPPRGRTWTGPYVKACSASLTALDAWALSHAESAITRCICQPYSKWLCPPCARYRRLCPYRQPCRRAMRRAQNVQFWFTLSARRVLAFMRSGAAGG